ncbi:thermonuclease family protein [Salegentibacter sp. HM20]
MKFTSFLLSFLFILASCKRTVSGRQSLEAHNSEQTMEVNNPEILEENNAPEGKLLLNARIIRIVDGDTAELLYNDELPLMLRLQHIDAPEKRGSQPYGNKAKTVLSDLCFGQQVTIVTDGDFDMGGRIIGEIINEDGLNVNKEMVRLGYAWHFKKYSDDMSYDALEQEAWHNKRGLWQEPNPVAPWNYRKK